MKLQKKNFASSVLASELAAGATTMVVAAGHTLPTTPTIPFRVIIWNKGLYASPGLDPDVEIVDAVYSSATEYTITRAKENTTDSTHVVGCFAVAGYTAGTITEENLDHNSLFNYSDTRHFLQTDITNLTTGLTTGIVTLTNGTGLIGTITNNSSNWNTAYGWGNHLGLYLPIGGGTLTGHLLFTDNTYDIGASGATRPRSLFLSSNATIGGNTSSVSFKTSTATLTNGLFSFGDSASATGTGAMAIGTQAVASNTNSISIGIQSQSTGINSFSFGPSAIASGTRAIQIGAGTNSTADAVQIGTYSAGFVAKSRLKASTTELVANEDSDDTDFRVESNGNTHAVFVDAGNDRVGIFNSAPTVALDVTGAGLISNTLGVTGLSTLTGGAVCTAGFGCNGKTIQTAYASGGAASTTAGAFGFGSDAERATLTTLVANIRLALVANGIMS